MKKKEWFLKPRIRQVLIQMALCILLSRQRLRKQVDGELKFLAQDTLELCAIGRHMNMAQTTFYKWTGPNQQHSLTYGLGWHKPGLPWLLTLHIGQPMMP